MGEPDAIYCIGEYAEGFGCAVSMGGDDIVTHVCMEYKKWQGRNGDETDNYIWYI